MDSENIDKLLEKYWNGETSLEEEEALKAHFRTSPIPESLKETAALFRYFEERRQKELTDNSFDKQVLQKLRRPKARTTTLLYNSMRIAAGIVVLILAVWLVRLEVRRSTPPEFADTYSDPGKAFEETKKALMMISRSFSTAEEQAKKINLFNEAQQEIRTRGSETEL